MKILSGAYVADSGHIELEGAPFRAADPLHARRCGIAMIYQELNLAPHLSVEENILLGEEPQSSAGSTAASAAPWPRKALAQLQHDNIPLDAPVHTRTIAEQQMSRSPGPWSASRRS
jgi:ribose transport system ATP-binding protein